MRELVILGTASAVPTKRRNHNGYFLRWDQEGILFDPGEGTQRQMRFAGLAPSDVTQVCVTHFHGDHCLGLPGVLQGIARTRVAHPVRVAYPAAGEEYWKRLREATVFDDTATVNPRPVGGEGGCPLGPGPRVTALPLSHRIPTFGYRIQEPDGWTMLPDRLAARGVRGPDIGRLREQGEIRTAAGDRVTLAECAAPRKGQSMAFVMDTRWCDNALRLADQVDLLVIESTFLDCEAELAQETGHLTARQAGRVAREAGARQLVLTHLSERYGLGDDPRFVAEAASEFPGSVVLAQDLHRVPLPTRPRPGLGGR
ncbi:ribonuclease Z [Spiractinospora alimapuensis]|uniref:ribonuclease Z n=1 Tax=Spiractinospora alimapuensis TaxID=2820884 RepID=UPI001EECE4B2|nr:ribonuclease Z [Spiractinospora alimapuensis]QVQ52674.1 ribonuclease Z [Spiractinospora alimapuensis]